MAKKQDLDLWVKSALIQLGGRGKLIDVAKIIWQDYEAELKNSGDLYYTWQYDMRWSAKRLRSAKIMLPAKDCPRGVWQLN